MKAPKRHRFIFWPARRVKLYIRAVFAGIQPGSSVKEEIVSARYEYYAEKLADIRSDEMVVEIGQEACDRLYKGCTQKLVSVLTR